jgi:hypothetical protein
VPIPPVRPDGLRGRVFRGSWAVRKGLLTPDQLRSRAWRRLRHDVYADAGLRVDHRLMTVGVSGVAPADAVFAGLSALALAGGDAFATAADPVEVVLPVGRRWRPGPGVRVGVSSSLEDVVVDRHRLSRTGPVRTALDLIRRGPVDDGVVLLDRLAQARLADVAAVRAAAEALPGAEGARRPGRSPGSRTVSRSHRRRRGCDSSCTVRGSRRPSPSSGSSIATDSSRGWTSPIPS